MAQPAPFDNTSLWGNFTSWTAHHLNVSKYAESIDLTSIFKRLGAFMPIAAVDNFGQRIIPDATPSMFNATTTTIVSVAEAIQQTAANPTTTSTHPAADRNELPFQLKMESTKGIGSVFSYATSKWALSCIIMAIVLNRTHIFAATRRRLRLRWTHRFVLRIVPIILLAFQARRLLRSIQCQTSADFSELRWGNATKSSDLMFAQPSPFLNHGASYFLLGASDKESCEAINMVPSGPNPQEYLRGSLSILWPLYGALCLSQFLETISCAVQGRSGAAETGMTLFELSLAFAEAESAISNQLGWHVLPNTTDSSSAATGTAIAISRSMIMRRVNTPPEVLLVALLSTMNHITSHALGIFHLQSKFRLAQTSFWAICLLTSLSWSLYSFSIDDVSSHSILRFPTVCIIGHVPHVIVLGGILICAVIYTMALGLVAATLNNASAEDEGGDQVRPSFWRRLADAHSNMQASLSLSDVRITAHTDFYSALLRAGLAVISMASEAVYLQEDHTVNLKDNTWLEDERLREIETLRGPWYASGLPGSQSDINGAIGLIPIRSSDMGVNNGYARERANQEITRSRMGDRKLRSGIGASERSGRWIVSIDFMLRAIRLFSKLYARSVLALLSWIGIRWQPQWLVWLASMPKQNNPTSGDASAPAMDQPHHDSDTSGVLHGVPSNDIWADSPDDTDYSPAPSEFEDDITSVISAADSEAMQGDDWENISDDEDLAEGQRTPTQNNPFYRPTPSSSRESSPLVDTPMPASELVRLLNPSSPEEREEARTLAAHLSSQRIVTRSRYARMLQGQRARVLAPPRASARAANGSSPADDEATVLERILLSRRAAAAVRAQGASATGSDVMADNRDWQRGASGMGAEGPQCVVCHSEPRTIIVWPCRCLSLCDDCRVNLAMNNYANCVCCRREVVSFSRIYVP